ncbi:hypothetical protein MYAM1_002127 [Malassezia yamatoensis]|uniref:HMG box domain-containing protein n=1 Tax=Malassezia yamatoensis TaxID=253288 RepID=A0AAJ5YUA1_9BASI|nr:hypothetical protein MYAM1_002127 [Malassezia yamatoensis]
MQIADMSLKDLSFLNQNVYLGLPALPTHPVDTSQHDVTYSYTPERANLQSEPESSWDHPSDIHASIQQNVDESLQSIASWASTDAPYSSSTPAYPPSGGNSHTRKMAPGHIKRPRNAFILFRSHAVASNLVPKEVERDHRNISRIISHMWRSLRKEERAFWEARAEDEKKEHRRQYPDYKYRPGTRRTHIHRRAFRKLSSTERECEKIADTILKACGRPGVKKRRSSTCPSKFNAPAVPSNPLAVDMSEGQTMRQSLSNNYLLPASTREIRAMAMDCRDVSSALFQPGDFAQFPVKKSRRSSSAPPMGSVDLHYDQLADWSASDTASNHDTPHNPFTWVLDTPLLSEQQSPNSQLNSGAFQVPAQCSASPETLLSPFSDFSRISGCRKSFSMENLLDTFSLDATKNAPRMHTSTHSPALLSPVSPTTIPASRLSLSQTESAQCLGAANNRPIDFVPSLWRESSSASRLHSHAMGCMEDPTLAYEFSKPNPSFSEYVQSGAWPLDA